MKKDKYKKVFWEERADQLAAIFKGHCRMSDEEFFALRLAYRRLYSTIWRGDRKDLDYRHTRLAGILSYMEDAHLINEDEVNQLINLALEISYPE